MRTVFVGLALLYLVYSKIDPSSVSISGFSSGAFFAVQYQLAYSASIKGAAIFAGGPFYCAQGSLNNALLNCMEGLYPIDLSTLESYASQQSSQGLLDPLSNLTKHNVYLYSGSMDDTVKPSVMKSLETMYRDLGVTNIVTKYDILGAHTFPTLDYGNLCLFSFTPYISICSYDGAGAALQQIYGNLKSPGQPSSSNYIQLQQDRFTGGSSPSSLSLGSTLYAYIPTSCRTNTTICSLHVSLHGCLQNADQVGRQWVEDAGFDTWAESNNIIMVYPQTAASLLIPSNPNGCWDWWGYVDSNYANKKGQQMVFMKNVVDFFLQNY
jgi:hypothetical protein